MTGVVAAAEFPLPERALSGAGVKRADLNGDGHEDIIVSNAEGFGVYLFVSPDREKKNLEWNAGWTQVMREGPRGAPGELPLFTDGEVKLENGRLVVKSASGTVTMTYEELLRVPGQKPRTAEESLKVMRVKPGHELGLAAAEPLVTDPVFVDWDERGRMWVVEMGDYPFAKEETTRDGSLTWKDGVPGESGGEALRAGRIRILEDADGDGRYEKSTLFLDGLRHPTGLACWKGGVFVSAIPDVFYAKDEDGDGRCDVQEPWFKGFTAGNPQHLVNGFAWGLDGWLHGANGDSGGEILCVKSGKKINLGTNDFRFDPRSGEFELETGRTQCGKWRDDFGNWFGNNNSSWGWHYWLPMAWLQQHPDLVVKAVRADVNPDKAVFPISAPVRRLNQLSLVNTLTSGCNAMPYRGAALGEENRNVVFHCEPANNLVHREVLDYSGATIRTARHAGDKGSEFLASEDHWFRPVMARGGPDGALYVVDMYRQVLEHPEWIPAEMAKRMELRGGETMGRIWRVTRSGSASRPVFPITERGLASANGWERDTAQRLILERNKVEDPEWLRSLVHHDNAAVRVQAAFTLRALGLMKEAELAALLRPLWPQVRGAAWVAGGSRELAPGEMKLLEEQMKKTKTAPVAKVPVIENIDPNRQKIVSAYLAALKLTGDAERGRAVYAKAGCIACHKLGALGIEVGPDLGTIAAKPPEQLIEAIFDPNRAVEERNAVTEITKTDGSTLAGLLVTETPGGLVLRLAGGVEMVAKRSEIKGTRTLKTSLMPAGLEGVISQQDCADLLAAIRAGK